MPTSVTDRSTRRIFRGFRVYVLVDLAARTHIDYRRGCLVGSPSPQVGAGWLGRGASEKLSCSATAFAVSSDEARAAGLDRPSVFGLTVRSEISRRRRPVRRCDSRGGRRLELHDRTAAARRRRPRSRARPAARDPPSDRSYRGARGTDAGSARQARRRFLRSAARPRARTCCGTVGSIAVTRRAGMRHSKPSTSGWATGVSATGSRTGSGSLGAAHGGNAGGGTSTYGCSTRVRSGRR